MAKKKKKQSLKDTISDGLRIYSVCNNPNLDGVLNSFELISEANRERCEEVFHPLDEWSESEYGNALAGECGELCNNIKKRRRGTNISLKECGKEMADVYLYLDLIASKMGINLLDCIINKFNEVSKKKKSKIRLSR